MSLREREEYDCECLCVDMSTDRLAGNQFDILAAIVIAVLWDW